MKTVIIFKSRHGTTEKVADILSQKFNTGTTDLIDIGKTKKPDIAPYKRVIVGGSIHVGKIQREIEKFCIKNKKELLKKELGLFICCMDPDDGVRTLEFEGAFSKELRDHAKACGIMGGEFLFEKMNILEKIAVKRIAHQDTSISKLDDVAIEKFAEVMG